jgi:ABC-type antimicrobial peptide transport system permease subunit
VALILCAIGLYAIVSFAVGQRTREIGVRTAMGAAPRQVVGMFFWRGLRLSVIGLVIGLTLSVIVVRLFALVNGRPTQPGILVIAAVVASIVVGVAALATWIPARRAATVDPLSMLRAE